MSKVAGPMVLLMFSLSASANVTLDLLTPIGSSTLPDGSSAHLTDNVILSYSRPYTFSGPIVFSNGVATGSLTVNPDVVGDLSSGYYRDKIDFSGSFQTPNFVNGTFAMVLPTLQLSDNFKLTGSPGQIIPWSFTTVVTGNIGLPDWAFANAYVKQTLAVTGGIGGTSALVACFGAYANTGGFQTPLCAINHLNIPTLVTVSGTAVSGATLGLSIVAEGLVTGLLGLTASGGFVTNSTFSGSLSLDPFIQIHVPDGVTVTSSSGVFPVPEPSTWLMFLSGAVVLAAISGRRGKLSARAPRSRLQN